MVGGRAASLTVVNASGGAVTCSCSWKDTRVDASAPVLIRSGASGGCTMDPTSFMGVRLGVSGRWRIHGSSPVDDDYIEVFINCPALGECTSTLTHNSATFAAVTAMVSSGVDSGGRVFTEVRLGPGDWRSAVDKGSGGLTVRHGNTSVLHQTEQVPVLGAGIALGHAVRGDSSAAKRAVASTTDAAKAAGARVASAVSSGAHSASSAAQRSLTTKVAKSVASRTGVFTQATVLQVTNDTPNTLKQPRLESSFAGAEFERTLQFPVPPGATHMAVLQEPRRVAGAGTRARWLLEFQDVPGAIWLELHKPASGDSTSSVLDNSTGLRTVLGSDGVQEVTVAGRGTVQAHVFTLRVDMQAGEGCTSVALKDEKLREIEALPGIGLAVAASHAARGDSVQATRAVIKGGVATATTVTEFTVEKTVKLGSLGIVGGAVAAGALHATVNEAGRLAERGFNQLVEEPARTNEGVLEDTQWGKEARTYGHEVAVGTVQAGGRGYVSEEHAEQFVDAATKRAVGAGVSVKSTATAGATTAAARASAIRRKASVVGTAASQHAAALHEGVKEGGRRTAAAATAVGERAGAFGRSVGSAVGGFRSRWFGSASASLSASASGGAAGGSSSSSSSVQAAAAAAKRNREVKKRDVPEL